MGSHEQFGGGDVQRRPGRWQAVNPVLLVLPIIAGAPVALREMAGSEGPEQTFRMVGVVLGWTILSIIIVWLAQAAWRLFGRSRLAGNTVFGVLCVLWAVGTWTAAGRESNHRHAAALAATVRVEVDQTLDRAKSDLETNGYVTFDEQGIERMAGAFENAGQAMKGQDAAFARATARFVREMGEVAAKEQADLDLFVEAGMFEPSTLMDRREFAERERLLEQSKASAEACTAFIENAPVRYRELLREEGVADRNVERCADDFMWGFRPAELLDVRKPDAVAFELMGKVLELLKTHHGRWMADEGGPLIFEHDVPDAVLGEYDLLMNRIEAAGEESIKLQSQMLERRQRLLEHQRRLDATR